MSEQSSFWFRPTVTSDPPNSCYKVHDGSRRYDFLSLPLNVILPRRFKFCFQYSCPTTRHYALFDMKLSTSSSVFLATLALSSSTSTLAAPARDAQGSGLTTSSSFRDMLAPTVQEASHCSAHRPQPTAARPGSLVARSDGIFTLCDLRRYSHLSFSSLRCPGVDIRSPQKSTRSSSSSPRSH